MGLTNFFFKITQILQLQNITLQDIDIDVEDNKYNRVEVKTENGRTLTTMDKTTT